MNWINIFSLTHFTYKFLAPTQPLHWCISLSQPRKLVINLLPFVLYFCITVFGDPCHFDLLILIIKSNSLARTYTRIKKKLCLGVRQSIYFSKLHHIYQNIICIPTLTITPNPNSDFESFWLLVKRGLYFRYFYKFIFSQSKISEV